MGAVIGSKEFRDEYCREKIHKWVQELKALCEIAQSEPHAAYTGYVKAFYSKLTYFMRTIENFEDYLEPIESVINEKLLPILFGQEESFNPAMRNLFRLSAKNGGLGIKNPLIDSKFQREASLRITRGHVEQILRQERTVSSFDQLGMTVKNHKQELLTSKTLLNIQDKIDVRGRDSS